MKRTLPLTAAYDFGAHHKLEHKVNEIRYMPFQSQEGRKQSIKRGHMIHLFEECRIFEEFKDKHWPFGNTPSGETKRLYYLRLANKTAATK